MLRRAGQVEEAQLTDLHARPELDRERRHVRQLERHVPGEPGVDEARGRVGQQAQAAERTLALQSRRDVITERHGLVGRREYELAGMQNERLVALGLDQPGEVRLFLRWVDVRV